MRWLTLLALLAPALARANVKSCAGQRDGTPCNADCQIAGVCQNQACTNGKPAPDGSSCATGNLCTVGDYCVSGSCTPGDPRVCPAETECMQASCDPQMGCVYTSVCDMATLPDLGGADLTEAGDLAGAADLAGAGDLAGSSDLAGAADLAGQADLAGAADLSGPPDGGADLTAVDLASADALVRDGGATDRKSVV